MTKWKIFSKKRIVCGSFESFYNLWQMSAILIDGGEGGIRTHGNLTATHALQACLLDHSSTSPRSYSSRFGEKIYSRVTERVGFVYSERSRGKPKINCSFCVLDQPLICDSLFLASEVLLCFSLYTNFTGLRLKVYLAPSPRLCSFRRCSILLVIPE